jgi:hypothetical protein
VKITLVTLLFLLAPAGANAGRPSLVGEWGSTCYALPKRHSIIFQALFTRDHLSAKAFQFADSSCQIFNLVVTIESDYLGGKKSKNGYAIDFSPTSVAIEISNPEALAYYNSKKSCGFSDWKLNEKRELINATCEATVLPVLQKPGVDIYNVTHGNLFFGKFPFGIVQDRPTALNEVLPLRKIR